ncbi:MAG TPA: hypothetical protein VHL11_06330 [Phototrophicaceae bacterium]|jgi:hypothetical protein|nr:hypothetical protein [Phototrophicaceae bacterium]
MRIFVLIILLLLSSGCIPEEPPLRYTDPRVVIKLDAKDFPEGWFRSNIERDFDWGRSSEFAYDIAFGTSLPELLVSRLIYIRYGNTEAAAEAYSYFQNGVYYSISNQILDWYIPEEANQLTPTEHKQLMCSEIQLADTTLICSYWAQYNQCLVEFYSHILPPKMSLQDFIGIIQDKIDPRMEALKECVD